MHTPTLCLLVLSLTTLVLSHPYPQQGHGKHDTPYQPVKISGLEGIKAFGGKFVCKNDYVSSKPKTIWGFQVCDGHKDCADSSDEASCSFSCPDGRYKCKYEEKCLQINQLCDNHPDCETSNDEKQCPSVCSPGQYRCKNEDKCIEASQVCDRKVDCLNSEDEQHCDFRQYTCKGGEVTLPFDSTCDGIPDCPEADDEANCETSGKRRRFCPNGWIAFNRSCYYVYAERLNFTTSVSNCANLGAHMVELNTLGELYFVKNLVEKLEDTYLWIGMKDEADNDEWRYLTTGEMVSFFDWHNQEPHSGETCAALYNNYSPRMVGNRCDDHYWTLCELLAGNEDASFM